MGLTMTGLLRKMLVALGLWGMTCVIPPLLPYMYNEEADEASERAGVAALVMWVAAYVPPMVLLSEYYRNNEVTK